jgi:hypothetical protein
LTIPIAISMYVSYMFSIYIVYEKAKGSVGSALVSRFARVGSGPGCVKNQERAPGAELYEPALVRFCSDTIVQTLGQQLPLCAVFTFDKTPHLLPDNDEIATQRWPGRSRLHGGHAFTQPGPKAVSRSF